MTPRTAAAKHTLWRALGSVLLSLAHILIPAIAAALLPLFTALAVEFLLLISVPLLSGARQPRMAKFTSEWAGWAQFGLGLNVWRHFPHWQGLLAGIAVLWALTRGLRMIEARLQLTLPRGGQPGRGKPDANYRALITPEGGHIRVLSEYESGRAYGPPARTILFDDGVLLAGVGLVARYSADGRYFAAIMPSPEEESDSLLLLDRRDKTLRWGRDSEHFWHIPEFCEPAPVDTPTSAPRRRPSLWLQDFLDTHSATGLKHFQDLWIDAGQHDHVLKQWSTQHACYSTGNPCHRLRLKPVPPISFMAQADPYRCLLSPTWQLLMDDADTGLTTVYETSASCSDDGRLFACKAHRLDAPGSGQVFWWWSEASGWQALPDFERFIGDQIGLDTAPVPSFAENEDALRLDARLASHVPGYGRFGIELREERSALDVPGDVDGHGIAHPATLSVRHVSLHMRLEPGLAGVGLLSVHTEPLANGACAVFSRPYPDAGPAQAWRCRIGDWQLPGLWLIKYRLLDKPCGIVLLPFVQDLGDSPQRAASSFVLALPAEKRLIAGPDFLVADVHDTLYDQIAVIEIAGRVDKNDNPAFGTALAPFDAAAPLPGSGAMASFLAMRKARYYYRIRRFELRLGVLTALPDWRTVSSPQACNAEGDFLYPTPAQNHAAWYFGGHSQSPFGWPHREDRRIGGYVMTSQGYGIGQVGPAMIWSGDGQFLVLTRSAASYDEKWRLLLLDLTHGLLHVAVTALPSRPRFEQFDGQGLLLTLTHPAWDGEKPSEEQRRISLAELTAMPAQAMVAVDSLRLDASQVAARMWWSGRPVGPLAPYYGLEMNAEPFGETFARCIAEYLKEHGSIGHSHPYYCGMGLLCTDGAFVYVQIGDWRPPTIKEALAMAHKGHANECRVFRNEATFVQWLAAQSDRSLNADEYTPMNCVGNQRLSRRRLQHYLGNGPRE